MSAVLFDLDGTLLDTAPDMVGSLDHLCREQGRAPLPYDLARAHVSNGSAGLLKVAFGESWQDQFPDLRQRFLQIYEARLDRATRLFPGIRTLIDTLDDTGVRWGVVTNKPGYLTEPLLEAMQLLQRCAAVVSGDTIPQRKPHPRPVLYALEKIGAAAHRSVYVGDAARDIQAGTAAGVATVAALYGYIQPGDDPAGWGADGVIRRPGDLLPFLAGQGIVNSDDDHERA